MAVLVSGCFGWGSRSTGRSGLAQVTGVVRIEAELPDETIGECAVAVTPLRLAPYARQGDVSGRFHPAQAGFEESDEFVVHARAGASAALIAARAAEYGFEYVRASGERYHIVRRRGTSLAEAQAMLRGGEIMAVEPNRPMVPLALPNDGYFCSQWALAALRIPQAWQALEEDPRFSLEDRRIVVAVIDTGIDFRHEDLNDPDLWVDGWDFVPNRETPIPYRFNSAKVSDGSAGHAKAHGTMVAGIIGALTNNKLGIAGAAWGVVRLMPIRVFGDGVDGENAPTEETVARAIEWALAGGAHVINLSLGANCGHGPACPSAPLRDALDRAWEAGVPVIAAAGNLGGAVFSPARYDRVIAVGATNREGQRAGYSAMGPELNVSAPGGTPEYDPRCLAGILSLQAGGGYGCGAGTSFAAPHVTAVVALMLARGKVTDPLEVLRTLEITARRPEGAFDPELGWGLVDAYAAVTGGVPTVFLGYQDGNRLIAVTEPVRAVGAGGAYRISAAPQGVWRLYAWFDVDGHGTVNEGDYFGVFSASGGDATPVQVRAGMNAVGYHITLTRYDGDELVVEFEAAATAARSSF